MVVQQSKLRELVPGGDEEANGTTTSTASTASTVDTSTTEATILPRSNFLRTYSGYNPFVTKVPLLSLYNHLVIYLFLPIAKKTVAVAFGFLTSLVCVGLFLGIELTQVNNLALVSKKQPFFFYTNDKSRIPCLSAFLGQFFTERNMPGPSWQLAESAFSPPNLGE